MKQTLLIPIFYFLFTLSILAQTRFQVQTGTPSIDHDCIGIPTADGGYAP